MSSLEIILAELDAAIQSADEARRSGLVQRFTRQLREQIDSLDEEKIGVYDEIIYNLARNIELPSRVELAEALADIVRAPVRTIRDLAFDDQIEVAGPVIRRSGRLSKEDTVRLAREKGQAHLLVLSERPNLPPAVTDIIVDRGHVPVRRRVAGNQTARFSEKAFRKLADSAEGDQLLANILARRRDIPTTLTERIVRKARALAAKKMVEGTLPIACNANDSIAADGNARMAVFGASPADLPSEGKKDQADHSPVDEHAICKMAIEGNITAAMRHIAKRTRLPFGYVVCLFSSASIDPLLDVLKIAGFHWTSVEPIVMRRLGKQQRGQMEKAELAFLARDRKTARTRIAKGLRLYLRNRGRVEELVESLAR
ncbi:MAG TPA: DUF2336 domain-containing protein [Rhodobacteraceae bacterium]|nr:DUF2336 domain-containing protein [Paracoccaceae bacterium]